MKSALALNIKRVFQTINPLSATSSRAGGPRPSTPSTSSPRSARNQGSTNVAVFAEDNSGNFIPNIFSSNVGANTFGPVVKITDLVILAAWFRLWRSEHPDQPGLWRRRQRMLWLHSCDWRGRSPKGTYQGTRRVRYESQCGERRQRYTCDKGRSGEPAATAGVLRCGEETPGYEAIILSTSYNAAISISNLVTLLHLRGL